MEGWQNELWMGGEAGVKENFVSRANSVAANKADGVGCCTKT